MKDDHIMSYFKFERKSNYKAGIYETLGLFENRFNFVMFYRVFVYEGTFVSRQAANKNDIVNEIDPTVVQEFLESSSKEYLQFKDDIQ